MKSVKKSYLLLAMVPLLLISQPKVHAGMEDALGCITGLVTIGTAVILIDYGIRVARETRFEREKLNVAQQVLNDTQKLYDNLSTNFEKELSFMGYLWNCTDQLKCNMNQRSNRFPYLSLDKQLSRAISDISCMTNRLVAKKKELCEQKTLLRRKWLIKRYALKISRFKKLNNRLQSLCSWLKQLQKTVVSFPEYLEEKNLNPSPKDLEPTPLELAKKELKKLKESKELKELKEVFGDLLNLIARKLYKAGILH